MYLIILIANVHNYGRVNSSNLSFLREIILSKFTIYGCINLRVGYVLLYKTMFC